jgi:hypothetical protein
MIDVAAGLISGGSSVVGSIIGGVGNKKNRDHQLKMQRRNFEHDMAVRDRSEAFAREDRDFTAAREDNAMQRQAADYEAAGINKMMAGLGGGGAAAGGGINSPSGGSSGGFGSGSGGSDVGGIISNAGKNISSSMLDNASAQKAEAEAVESSMRAEWISKDAETRIALMDSQMENYDFQNKEIENRVKTYLKDIEKMDSDILLQSIQYKLYAAQTETEKAELLKVAAAISLMAAQTEESKERAGTEGFKRNELEQQMYLAIDKAKESQAAAEKIIEETRKITSEANITEFNEEWQHADKIQQWGNDQASGGMMGRLFSSVIDIFK